jgi:hypothetical protein
MFGIKIKVPSDVRKEIEAVETWVVSWIRRTGEYSFSWERCYQSFTDESKALEFKSSLVDAHKLIGNTYQNEVTIKKQNSGL